jgi:hypothetical protein
VNWSWHRIILPARLWGLDPSDLAKVGAVRDDSGLGVAGSLLDLGHFPFPQGAGEDGGQPAFLQQAIGAFGELLILRVGADDSAGDGGDIAFVEPRFFMEIAPSS